MRTRSLLQRFLLLVLVLSFLFLGNIGVVSAQGTDTDTVQQGQDAFDEAAELGGTIVDERFDFVPLTKIPGITGTDTPSVAVYLSRIFFLLIGIGAVLAVLKIAYAGVKYMLSEAFTNKEEAKKDIQNALLGLLIILSVVLILRVINPNLLNLNIFSGLTLVQDFTDPYAFEDQRVAHREGGTEDRVVTCQYKYLGTNLNRETNRYEDEYDSSDCEAECREKDGIMVPRSNGSSSVCVYTVNIRDRLPVSPGDIEDRANRNAAEQVADGRTIVERHTFPDSASLEDRQNLVQQWEEECDALNESIPDPEFDYVYIEEEFIDTETSSITTVRICVKDPK